MPATVRLIRLTVLARLRAAGWAPWLMLFGWLLFATLQEPELLRRYGCYLIDDASWTGGVVLLAVLLLAEARSPRRQAWLCNLVTLGLVAGASVGLAAALDRSLLAPGFGERCWQLLAFVLAWSPMAVAASRSSNAGASGGGLPPKRVLMVLAATLWIGSMLSAQLRAGPEFGALAVALLATLGAASHPVVRS